MSKTDHPGPPGAPPTQRDDETTGGTGFDSTLDGSDDLPPGLVESAPPRRLGRYVLLEELGAGGMGVVYKAWDPTLDRPVALKMMHAGRVSTRAVRRFLNEARAVARIAHRHIVEIHDIGVVERMPYFTMSLVDGPSLEAWLRARPPPDPRALCAMLAPVARALGHAHRAGVIHRDVKPANLLVDPEGEVRVVDFGVAQLADDDLTRTGQVIGTPAYMAPEQARGADDIDARVDVYGLGGVLYRALTGGPPLRVAVGGPLTLPAVDRDFRAIVGTALAADPARRYPDTDALAADLERFARGEPVQAALPGRARRLGWWVRRRRVGLLALGGLLIGGFVGLQVMQWWSAREERSARAATEAAAERLLVAAGDEIDALRSDGRSEAARARLEAVSRRLDVQGTDALSHFLLDAARDASSDGRGDAPALLATIYAQSGDPALRYQALLGLGQHHGRRSERVQLDAVLETLRRRHPAAFDSGPVRALRRDAALLGRRPAEAAALLEAEQADFAGLLRALGQTTTSALPTAPLPPGSRPPLAVGPWMGDGGPWVQVGFDIARLAPSLTPVGRLPDPPGGRWQGAPRLFLDPEGRPVMLGMVRRDGPPRAALYRVVDGDRPPLRLWQADNTSPIEDAVQADLHGDGVAPIYIGHTFDLIALVPEGDDRWRRVEPHRRTPHTGSVISGLAVTAVDGRPALAATFAEWLAYDIRRLRPAPDGRLVLEDRGRWGHLVGVAADRRGWLWAHGDGASLNRAVFAAGTAPVEPTLYGFRRGEGLAAPVKVPLPDPGPLDETRAFDLLGDGRTSVAANRLDGGALITFDAAGPAPWTIELPGYAIRGALDLDGDGDDELVAQPSHGGPIRVLGAGQTPLPPLAAPMGGAAPTGDGRLSDLVALGRLRVAREQYRLRVRLGTSPIASARRAGALGLRLDDAAGAAADFAESARRAARAGRLGAARDGWRAAADAAQRARDGAAERAALQALVAYVPPQERDAIDARIAGLASIDVHPVRFDAPLDTAWRVVAPGRISRDVFDARLVVRGRGDDGPLAALSLDVDGPRVSVEGTVGFSRLDIAGSLHVAIVAGEAVDGDLLAGVAVSGEKRNAQLMVVEAVAAGGARELQRAPVSLGALDQPPTRFVIDLDRALGVAHVVWGEPPDGGGRVALSLPPSLAHDGPLTLVIAARPSRATGDGWIRATLGPLTLTGAVARPTPPTPVERARLALADGDPAAALATLDGAGEPAPLERAEALDALDRFDEAHDLLVDLPPELHAERDRLLRGWMHSEPAEAFDRLLRRGLAPLAEQLFFEVWGHLGRLHPRDRTGRAALAAVLPRFDRGAPPDSPRARRLGALLRTAVRHALLDGDLRAARRRSDRLLAVTGASRGGPGTLSFSDLWGLIDRARIAVRAGRTAAARGWVRRAIDGYPAPDVAADLVRAQPELVDLFEGEPSPGHRTEPSR